MSLFVGYDHTDLPLGADGTPHDFYRRLRDEAFENGTPIGWSEALGGFWVVVGREESQAIHRDVETFSSTQSSFPLYASATGNQQMLSEYDPPEHSRYRALVAPAFSPANIGRLEDEIRRATHELIDGFVGQRRVDVRTVLANRLPAAVTAAMLGVPVEHGGLYRSWVNAMAQSHLDPEGSSRALAGMKPYFDELLVQKRREPDGLVMSHLIEAEVDGERLSEEELLDFFSVLLIGGLDNTALLLANIVWHLARDRELRERLSSEPELIPLAMEEFLRFYSPGKPARVVRKEIVIGGVRMKPGQMVHFAHPVANRDPREFADPDRFIPDRSPNRHLALGSGIHRCLGMHLLKLELRVATEVFLERVPQYRLDPDEQMEWECGHVEGIVKLPIIIGPEH